MEAQTLEEASTMFTKAVTPALLTPAANSQSVHNETKQLNTSWLH
jgi:hypothetical protein